MTAFLTVCPWLVGETEGEVVVDVDEDVNGATRVVVEWLAANVATATEPPMPAVPRRTARATFIPGGRKLSRFMDP